MAAEKNEDFDTMFLLVSALIETQPSDAKKVIKEFVERQKQEAYEDSEKRIAELEEALEDIRDAKEGLSFGWARTIAKIALKKKVSKE